MTNPANDSYNRRATVMGSGLDSGPNSGPNSGSASRPDSGPEHLRWSQRLAGGAHALIRHIERLDSYAVRLFIDGLSTENKHQRFLMHLDRTGETFITHLTHVDGLHEVALVAVMKDGAAEKVLGLCYYRKDIEQNGANCTLMVADDWQQKGLGAALIRHLIEVARADALVKLSFVEYAENLELRHLAHELGFHVHVDPDDTEQLIYTLNLSPPSQAGAPEPR